MIDCKNCSSYDNCTDTKCPIYEMWVNRKFKAECIDIDREDKKAFYESWK